MVNFVNWCEDIIIINKYFNKYLKLFLVLVVKSLFIVMLMWFVVKFEILIIVFMVSVIGYDFFN